MPRKFTFTTQIYEEKTEFPTTGDVDVIYIDASTNIAYRYDESYYQISSTEVNIWGALGSVSKGGGGGGGGATWGSITGTLSSQTDLQTALDAKQDDLTLTTTGTSGAATLVGSTLNIPQYGAAGITPTHVLFPPRSNFYYGTGIGLGTSTMNTSNGVLILSAFTPAYNLTVSELTMQVTTALVGGLLKVAIYSDLNGVPHTKLFESATAATDTTGTKTVTGFSFTFNARTTYWVSMIGNGTIGVRGITSSSSAFAPIIANSSTTQFYQSWYIPSTFVSLPSTLTTPTVGNLNGSAVPYVVFRAS